MMRTRKSFTRDGGQTIKLPRTTTRTNQPMVDRHLYSSLECQNRGSRSYGQKEHRAEKKKKEKKWTPQHPFTSCGPPPKKAPFREHGGLPQSVRSSHFWQQQRQFSSTTPISRLTFFSHAPLVVFTPTTQGLHHEIRREYLRRFWLLKEKKTRQISSVNLHAR